MTSAQTEEERRPPAARTTRWGLVVEALTRPYRVTVPMILLVLLVPLYIFIAELVPGRPMHAPALPLDRVLPLQPAWALVYGALYLFLIVLPVLIVRPPELIRRTVFAYLTIWIAAYVCFLCYPTAAPRPAEVVGRGYAAWGLRFLYEADPPYNCFPSLHVAHSFVSALACYRVQRRVGIASIVIASFVAISTLFTKQHYVLDVVAGIALAGAAYALFLRGQPREPVPELDRRAAPVIAASLLATMALGVAAFWVVYRVGS